MEGNIGDRERLVKIAVDSVKLEGVLNLPGKSRGVVIFAHGSGSSRLSPRNQLVASILQAAGLGTLLFDLLTGEEDSLYENRFNIDLLADRLVMVTRWFEKNYGGDAVRVGYFGSSTGAAAALQAAVKADSISAIVSRGGRTDLAAAYLPKVRAPTLLIVGEYDEVVVGLNRESYEQLRVEKKLAIVPRATHLFEESGALEEVARLAKDWFVKYLL